MTASLDHKLAIVQSEMARDYRPASDILEELDTAAGAMLRIPSAFVPRDVLEALHEEVLAAAGRMVEGDRIIDEAHEFLARCLINSCGSIGSGRWLRGARLMHQFMKDEEDLKRAREEEFRQMRESRL